MHAPLAPAASSPDDRCAGRYATLIPGGPSAQAFDHRAQRAGSAVVTASLDGITQVRLPVGAGPVGTVDMFVLADDEAVTVVDCGVWHPEAADGGIDAFESYRRRAPRQEMVP